MMLRQGVGVDPDLVAPRQQLQPVLVLLPERHGRQPLQMIEDTEPRDHIVLHRAPPTCPCRECIAGRAGCFASWYTRRAPLGDPRAVRLTACIITASVSERARMTTSCADWSSQI